MQSGAVMISNFLQLFTKSTRKQRETVQMYVTNVMVLVALWKLLSF